MRGSIYLGAEDLDHLMMRLAKNEINFGHYIPLDDIVNGLLRVTAAEIQEMAQELLRRRNTGPSPCWDRWRQTTAAPWIFEALG